MKDSNKKKKILFLILRIAGLVLMAGLCVPMADYINQIISGGETTVKSLAGTVVCTCFIVIVILALIAAIRAMTGYGFKLTVGAIVVCIVICVGAVIVFINYGEDEPVIPKETVSPRPTVTPPAVVIEEKPDDISNPESGEVFYKKYADNTVTLTFDNASSSDMYIKLRNKDGTIVLTFYIRGNDTVSVKAPIGTYEYVCALGKTWENTETYFGENTKFKKSKEFRLYRWGTEHEINLSKGLTELLEISQREFEK